MEENININNESTNNLDIPNSDSSQLYLEKNEYEIKLYNDITHCDIDTNVLRKVLSTLICTFFVGAFFTWCSAGDTSNYVKLLNNKYVAYVIMFLPAIIELIFLYSIYLTVKNRKLKIDIESYASDIKQNELIVGFILTKLNIQEEDYHEYTKIIYNLGNLYPDGILFDKCIFSDYINQRTNYLLKYLGLNFQNNLKNVIISKHLINGFLIDKGNSMYSYIMKDNGAFIVKAGLMHQ